MYGSLRICRSPDELIFGKFKTMEDAAKAYGDSERKIASLSQTVAKLQKDTEEKAKKSKTDDDDHRGKKTPREIADEAWKNSELDDLDGNEYKAEIRRLNALERKAERWEEDQEKESHKKRSNEESQRYQKDWADTRVKRLLGIKKFTQDELQEIRDHMEKNDIEDPVEAYKDLELTKSKSEIEKSKNEQRQHKKPETTEHKSESSDEKNKELTPRERDIEMLSRPVVKNALRGIATEVGLAREVEPEKK